MSKKLLDAVYQAIVSHDTRFDGIYYVGIKSTGIFCRPSCRSRTPRKENISIFSSIESAREAGFRACKRCRPDDPGRHGPDAQLAQRVQDLVEEKYDSPITLADMAGMLNVSPYHLQRVFKRITGTTPARHLHGIRIQQAMLLIKETDCPVKDIAARVGYRSLSHFTMAFQKSTGLTPSSYRELQRGEEQGE